MQGQGTDALYTDLAQKPCSYTLHGLQEETEFGARPAIAAWTSRPYQM